jgi:adenylate cyclase
VSGDSRERVRRHLAAILIAGYTRSSSGDERDGFAGLKEVLTEIIEPVVPQFGGSVVNSTGERALTEFGSVVAAVRCAVALRDRVTERNNSLAAERRIHLRIGINLGDIIAEEGDIFGDGVNIAARIEALANPGTICVSGSVRDQIVGKVDFDLVDLGPQNLKNIYRPIRVFRIGETAPEALPDEKPGPHGSPKFDERRAIAVLPFNNFSHDPEQEFFADGITEDIISLLAGWRAFPVIARNSTFTYKGQNVDVKKIGEELGVRYVLEGSVRKSGRRVRITAQLVQADTGHHIMAEHYDRDLTDLFDLQDEIVTTIAGAIEPELLKFERERIAEQPQHNEDAYEPYQRGMWHHYRQNKADNIEAQAYFRRALAIDPQYPQATAALSITLTSAAMVGWAEDRGACFEDAYALGQQGVSLDPRYPNAHFALGLACMWTSRSGRGIAAFEEAINLNPSFAAAYVLLGQMYLYDGRPEEAIEEAEKGIRLSPSDPRLFIWLPALAGAQYQMRHYEAAIEAGRRSWTLNRNWPGGLRYVVAGLAQLDRMDEAAAALVELRKLNPSLAFIEGNLTRLFTDKRAVEHVLDGLRKAGFS